MEYGLLRLPEAGDKVRYNSAYYDNLRLALNAIQDPQAREYAIHFSYCVQNLHKNFEEKIKSLLVTYNKTQQLPHGLYFEPKSTTFPIKKDKDGNKLSDDGLRTFVQTFVHHADMYDMKSIGLTWNNLILQYQQSFDFAIANGKVIEWGKAGQEGCFEGCIGEIYDWYLRTNPSAQNEPQELEHQSEAGTSQPPVKEFLALEEALTYAGNNLPNWGDLKAEEALTEIKRIVKIKDTFQFPDDETMVILVDIYGFEFEDDEKQKAFDEKRKRKADQDRKIAACFDRAKAQLKTSNSKNAKAYIDAFKHAMTVLHEPLELSVLDKFNSVIKNYTQLNVHLSSFSQIPSSTLLSEIREMESALQMQIANLPKKPNIKNSEFIRVYSGPGGGLVAVNNAFRELQQQIDRTIEAVAKTQESKTSKKNIGSKRAAEGNTRNLLNEHLKTRRKMQPDEHQVATSALSSVIQNQSALAELINENIGKLIRENAIELPSYIQPKDLVDYLLGLTEIDKLLIHKGERKSQQRPAVGTTTLSAQDHQQLLRELQSAFQDRGLASTAPKDLPDKSRQSIVTSSQVKTTSSAVSASSSASRETVTPEYIKRRLNVLLDVGAIGVNYPLEGEKGILKYLFSQDAELAKRKVDYQFKTLVSANKQAGSAIQDKKAFLAHAKQFHTVSNLLKHEKIEATPSIPLPEKSIKPLELAASSNKENIENIPPSTQQQKTDVKPKKINCPSAIYEESWQDFQSKLDQITLSKTDGFITQNAFKKIQHFSILHRGSPGTATQKHKRLTELRSLLLGINHKNIKNAELKGLITQYCLSYNKLPEVPKRALSWKRSN